jgi:hypothetical protein
MRRANARIVRTYTNKRRKPLLDDEEDETNNDASAVKTSQSARFTEHSGFQSSTELPLGAIRNDFVNHEPAVMFRDSGSTVEDTSSVQQRLLEQVGKGEKGVGTSGLLGAAGGEKLSSSLGWLDGSGETCGEEKADGGAGGAGAGEQEAKESLNGSGRQEQPTGDSNDLLKGVTESQQQRNTSHASEEALDKPHASPMVEIRIAASSSKDSPSESVTAQKSSRGRKRKAEAEKVDSEPLDSDDRAVGLPKERYVPRPSRRRATTVAEEPIDYSVRPERTAKVKRTKTTETSPEGDIVDIEALKAEASESKRGRKADKHSIEEPAGTKQTEADHASDEKLSPSQQQEDESVKKAETTKQQSSEADKPSSSITVKPKEDTDAFIKPAIPTPKTKPSSKARRSHTTIFEDHVEFIGSHRSSPSLSQQQAKRKSALQPTQTAASGANQKKRRSVVLGDEDEDELAHDNEAEEEQPPPKKRGRGRPPKGASKAKPKSADTVADDSEEDEEDRTEVEDAPKKAGRGRKSKVSASNQAKDTASDKENEGGASSKEAEQLSNDTPAKPNATDKTNEDAATQKARSSAQEMPTPSPEKEPEKTAPTPQKANKGSPTSHSPIKGSSKVPLRVGLSKRTRIPSLLRMMKPPKR